MVKREVIKGKVFIAQTTYYIYRSEESLKNNDHPFCITSDIKVFNKYKKQLKQSVKTKKP